MEYKSIRNADLNGKIVVIRTDYNVPVRNGVVTESTRIEESIPTLKYIIEQGAKQIHILSHLGRPKGEVIPNYTLQPIVPVLEDLLGTSIDFRKTLTVSDSKIQLHENIRFHAGEKSNDPAFVSELNETLQPDVFIIDGFSVAHRAQASVIGLADHVPAYAGFLLEKEIKHLGPFVSSDKKEGLTLMTGGAKIDTKIGVLEHFAKTAENILIGGALSNTFLLARGFDVGESLCEKDKIDIAQKIRQKADTHHTGIHKPIDVVVADDYNAIESATVPVEDVCGDMKIFDIGPHTISSFKEIIKHSKTVIWNGPMGCFEQPMFANGTKLLLEYLAEQKDIEVILGGGDTLNALKQFDIPKDKFTHVSTGGGAMLEFLEGKALPGIEIVKA